MGNGTGNIHHPTAHTAALISGVEKHDVALVGGLSNSTGEALLFLQEEGVHVSVTINHIIQRIALHRLTA